MSKWIKFIDYTEFNKKKQAFPRTKIFVVRPITDSIGSLGTIKWYGPWRQYAFFPGPECLFEKTCLQDITDFLKTLMEERKNK